MERVGGILLLTQVARVGAGFCYLGCRPGAAVVTPLTVHFLPAATDPWLQRAQAAQAVQHRNLATVRHVEQFRDWLVFAEDRTTGYALSDVQSALWARGEPLPVELVVHLLGDVLLGLSSAHLQAGGEVLHGGPGDGARIRIGLDGRAVLGGLGAIAAPAGQERDVHDVGELGWTLLRRFREAPVAISGLRMANLLVGGEKRVPLDEECPSLPAGLARDIMRLTSLDGSERMRTALDGVRLLESHLPHGPRHAFLAALLDDLLPGTAAQERRLHDEALDAARTVDLTSVPEVVLPAPLVPMSRAVMPASRTSLAVPDARFALGPRPTRTAFAALTTGVVAGSLLYLARSCGM